ncbi:MAG: AAA family ATPase [Nitrospinae bacterium]|nr:AAA family ATPase [Nitrospinota bacterium]
MSLKDKSYRLFEYISQIYSIDLPVNRDVAKYGAEIWWQSDIVQSSQCILKEFNEGNSISESNESSEDISEEIWLSVTKRAYENPPELPLILKEWVILYPLNPSKLPISKPSISKTVSFDLDTHRVTAFKKYSNLLKIWQEAKTGSPPPIPENIVGWIDSTQQSQPLTIINSRDIEERFEDDKNRVTALNSYSKDSWKFWSERTLPLFKANVLYDQLFSLRQRLDVEGDRIEIIWGHLFLSWNHSNGNIVYHPLILTPMNLSHDSKRRNISLTPSQTVPTKLDLDCLINLDYPLKDELIKYTRIVNSGEPPVEAWNHNQMRGLASTITGYLSKESAERANLYTEKPLFQPPIESHPIIYNAPVIFVRERTRRLWVDDAKKVAEAIYKDSDIPPFIRSLAADPHTKELPNPDDYTDDDSIDEDDGEHLLPLLYNDQQEEIVKRLKRHFGVLVQGPPGTGKSHTIANLVSSLLARGKRVLVTSQTENALKVLRDYIPQEIRSLCVSQLGNDTEAKGQLNEAVESIGKHLAEKNSLIVEQNIKQIKKELRVVREERARLRNQIKDWVELDSCTIKIDGEIISAHKTSIECSENESIYSWFPDNLSPDTKPPLSEQELHEMCSLLKEVSPEDRKACLQYLPDLKDILPPKDFSKRVSRLKASLNLSVETEDLRSNWNSQLKQAKRDDIEKAILLLEEALTELYEIKESWQFKILDLIVSVIAQDNYWQSFIKRCSSYRDSAWQAYQVIQGCEITVENLSPDFDVNAAIEELEHIIKKGKKPSNWIIRISLSKAAKLLYDSVKVDKRSLLTPEKINTAKAYFSYRAILEKIDTLWRKTLTTVNGPELDIAKPMPLAEIDEKIKNIRSPVYWKEKYLNNIKDVLITFGGHRKQIFHKQEALEEYLKTFHGQIAEIEKLDIKQNLSGYRNFLLKEFSSNENAHNLWNIFADATSSLSIDKYMKAYTELMRLLQVSKKVERLEYLSNKLKDAAPNWHESLEKRAIESGQEALEENWAMAWRWQRLNEWLNRLHNRESVESLQTHLERLRKKERELIVQLVKERTWQRQLANVKDYHYKALVAWADAMRKYGKTGGKYAQRWLSAAAKAMIDAVGAVPAWIMTSIELYNHFQQNQEFSMWL